MAGGKRAVRAPMKDYATMGEGVLEALVDAAK
jgi:hypothetical protein